MYSPCSGSRRASARGGAGAAAPGCPRAGGGAGTPAPCAGPSPRGSPAGGTWRRGRSRLPCLWVRYVLVGGHTIIGLA